MTDSVKKPLAVQLLFDIKEVRRAIAILGGDVLSDEDIIARYFDREPVPVDLSIHLKDMEYTLICASFVSQIEVQLEKEKGN